MSGQAVMLFALISAFSRAGLNIIDRYQIGLKRLSILNVNLWNNIIPAIIMTTLCMSFGLHRELMVCVFDWKTIVFSGLIQLVAYSFSYAFRHLNVNEVTVVGKMSDLFIPVGIFFVTRYWEWGTYGFAVATTLVCLPILWADGDRRHSSSIKTTGAYISGALVLQASLAPVLILPVGAGLDVLYTLTFTTAVIVWRAAWALLPMLGSLKIQYTPSLVLLSSPVFMLRTLLTVTTQTTFILALDSTASAIAWPILNSTGIFAMLLSSLLLREKHTGPEKWIVIAITILALVRFFSL